MTACFSRLASTSCTVTPYSPVSSISTTWSDGANVAQRDQIGAMFSCSLLAPCWIASRAVESKMRSIFFWPRRLVSNKFLLGRKNSYTSSSVSCHIIAFSNALASRFLRSAKDPSSFGNCILSLSSWALSSRCVTADAAHQAATSQCTHTATTSTWA